MLERTKGARSISGRGKSSKEQKLSLPLTGIRVLSFSRLLPGAYCTRLLADLGAEVTKIEQPGSGDPLRLRPGFFAALDGGKKSLTCDLKSAVGQEICYKLARQMDIVVEGFRPGVAARLKVDYASFKAINPRVIYVSITGFGQDGPYRDTPSHDLMNQAIAGVLADKMPLAAEGFTQPLLPAGDFSSAMFAVISILAALYEAKASGRGRYFDVSMTDGLVSWMGVHLTTPADLGASRPLAGYGLFKTLDGRFLALAVDHELHLWRNLCTAIGRPELGELTREERTERYVELTAVLKAVMATRGRDDWLALLRKADVPVAPAYRTAEEVAADPQLIARQIIFSEPGKIGVGSPLPFSELKGQPPLPAPSLGQDTEAILESLGYAPRDIQQMKNSGAI